MNFRVGSKTDIGRARERNEDSFLVKEPLFAVADGMGGHRGGDVASAMALQALDRLDLPDQGPLAALVEQIKEANQAVLERGAAEGSLRGMGTTLTAMLAEDGKAHLAHVGDSRAYLLRDGHLQRLTEDHTLVQRMVREGRIRPDEAARHPQRNVLTRALGVDDDLPVDEFTLDLHPGDRIVLCTDGLTNMVEEDRIRHVLESEPDPQSAAERLVEEANAAGGDDNITVIVVEARGDGDARTAYSSGGAVATAPGPGGAEAVRDDTAGAHRAPSPSPARPGRRRRIAVRAVIVLVVVAAGLAGLRVYLNHQWYVGDSNGRVAIFHGIPAAPLGYHLSHVAVPTVIPANRAEQLQPYRDLRDGITASSFPDARSIVSQIRRDVLAQTRRRAPGTG